jgi:hypothetical protein
MPQTKKATDDLDVVLPSSARSMLFFVLFFSIEIIPSVL